MALDHGDKLNSLGFAKPPSETRVVVAMSGGVDSSVVAAELAREGYDVVGVTLQLYDHGAALAKKGACCAGQDIHDARRVAEKLGFPHYVLDYENIFRETSASGSPILGFPQDDGFGRLIQGHLEGSNVEIVQEMVDMITALRAYEINSKAVQTSEQMAETANNLIR